jgi:Flp pilus assembly protein TadD
MHCKHYCSIFLFTGILLCNIVIASGGLQADQQVGAEEPHQSPFSLDTEPQPTSTNRPQHPVTDVEQTSPFALPATASEKTEVYNEPVKSPFALPASEQTQQDSDYVDKVFDEDPRTAEELLEAGMQLARDGKLDEARITMAKSVLKNPGNVVALNNLGLVLRKLDRFDDALDAYQYALQVDSTYALTYKNMGVLLEKKGENKRAAEAYMKYAQLAPAAQDRKNVEARAKWLLENR